jgi:pimeloyl-ACP methyl ester carboxylesterase
MRLLAGILILLLTSCAPNQRSPAQSAPDPAELASVRVERHVIAGFNEVHTPPQYNKAIYLRFYAEQTKTPRAVVVLMPGILGGATNFDRLARTIIAQDRSLEVWAIDRRSNLLEDHSALLATWNAKDPLIAWKSFVGNAGKPGAFKAKSVSELGFMGYWGLETHVHDLHKVILEAHKTAPRVFLGGHSLGSVLVTMYAGWDFAGQSGASNIDGLILLDGAAGNTLAADITQDQYENGFENGFGRTAGSKALEAGTAPGYFDALGINPTSLAKYSSAALLAHFDPNGDSPGGFVDYPASNLAAGLLGNAGGDNDYSPIPAFSLSTGHAEGQTALNLFAVILTGWKGFSVGTITGPLPGKTRVEWIAGKPGEQEFTDPNDFADRFWSPLADYQEWYFPARLTLDLAAVRLEAPEWIRQKMPMTQLENLKIPILNAIGSRGVVTEANAFAKLEAKIGRKIEPKTAQGLTHLDVLAATNNPIAGWIVNFSQER